MLVVVLAASSATAQRIGLGEYSVPKPTEKETFELQQEHLADAEKLRRDVEQSQVQPFKMAMSLVRSQTVVERSANFGIGDAANAARRQPTLDDRDAASRQPEAASSITAKDDAILTAVFQHFFGYRDLGFAKDASVYFLGVGSATGAPSPGVLAKLADSAEIKERGIVIRPASKAMFVIEDGIRDADSGSYGALFRVDDITPQADGSVTVTASFSERDMHVFTKTLVLRNVRGVWKVVSDADYRVD